MSFDLLPLIPVAAIFGAWACYSVQLIMRDIRQQHVPRCFCKWVYWSAQRDGDGNPIGVFQHESDQCPMVLAGEKYAWAIKPASGYGKI